MTGKAKPKKHTAKEIAAKIDAATTNRGGGKAGLADRSGHEKGGHAKFECPHCKITAPDVKSMQIHHESKHPKIPYEEDKTNPFLSSHASGNQTPSPDISLSYSVSSSQSFDKKLRKQLKKQAILRSLFLAWRGYAVQVKRDKVLFVRIRDFIIRRLTRAAYKAMKVHYITKGIIRHKRKQR